MNSEVYSACFTRRNETKVSGTIYSIEDLQGEDEEMLFCPMIQLLMPLGFNGVRVVRLN